MDDEKKKSAGAGEPRNNEKLSRREAMKRMAKGIALVGTLGVTGIVTQGQDDCYSNAYYDYSYYNYRDSYTEYHAYYYDYNDSIYLDYYDYHNYLDAYYYANGY